MHCCVETDPRSVPPSILCGIEWSVEDCKGQLNDDENIAYNRPSLFALVVRRDEKRHDFSFAHDAAVMAVNWTWESTLLVGRHG